MNDAPHLGFISGRGYPAGMPRPVRPYRARGRIPEVTYVTPPKPSSFPAERAQLEFSSRSLVFPSDGDRVLRVWGPTDAPYVVGVRDLGARWEVTGWGVDPPEARAAVRALFSFDHALDAFYRLARREPVLAPAVGRFRGLRLPRDANVFEALVHSVIGQQLSVRAANTIKERLFASAGSFEEVDGVRVPRVPSPGEVDALGVDGLRRTGLSGAKSRAILALAGRERRHAFDADALAHAPADEAVGRLDEEPGVGRWTAENALLRGVGRTDLFIAGDLGVRAALAAYGVLPRSATEDDARAWAARWYPGWGSYATLYLWRRWVADGTPSG